MNTTRIGWRLGAAVSAAALAAGLMTLTASEATAAPPTDQSGLDRPLSIPALQQWEPGNNRYELGPATRIVLRPASADVLADTAETLAADLKSYGDDVGRSVLVTEGAARDGDIVLEIGPGSAGLGPEGYEFSVSRFITVTAPTAAGVFYGTRTLLQLFSQGRTVAGGEARDWPAYQERGLFVDIARIFFDHDWLADEIRNMASLKMNYLYLHFSDNEGFRIESDLGVESTDHLTKAEVRDLIALADKYHVTIVPEIDMPGHLGAVLEHYHEFWVDPAAVWINSDTYGDYGKLDYSIPEARQLLFDLVGEFIDLFPGPFWAMGGDEYLPGSGYSKYPQLLDYAQEAAGPAATGADGYRHLINEMNQFVGRQGKTMRIWNDYVTPNTVVSVDRDVVIDWWTDVDSDDYLGSLSGTAPNAPLTPQGLLDAGYRVLNTSFLPTYDYPPGGGMGRISMECVYAQFGVERFSGYMFQDTGATCGPYMGGFKTVAAGASGLLGSRLTLFNSGGTWTQEEAAEGIYEKLRVVAQRTWGSPEHTDGLATFQSAISGIGPVTSPALELARSSWAAPAAGGGTTIKVATNLVKSASDDAGWLAVDTRSGSVELTADPNPDQTERTATVTVVAGDLTATVAVTQAAAEPTPTSTPTPTEETPTEENGWLGSSVFTKGASTGLAYRSSRDFATFTGVVEVDGAALAKDQFSATAGSTVVTLKPAYLETLAVGTHRLAIGFAAGTLEADFTVRAAQGLAVTGASAATVPVLAAALLMLALGGLAVRRAERLKAARPNRS